METYKNYERESKTKAFSKEGLQRQREKERRGENGRKEITEWLQNNIDKLKRQIEQIESEIESIDPKKRKNNSTIEECNRKLESRNFHLDCLEKTLRLWENEAITKEQVWIFVFNKYHIDLLTFFLLQIDEIRSSVDYYIDNYNEPDFYDDDSIYDNLGLDDIVLDSTPLPINIGEEEDNQENGDDQGNETDEVALTDDTTSSSASLSQEQVFVNKNEQKQQTNIPHQQEQQIWGNVVHNQQQHDIYQKQNYIQQQQKRPPMMNQTYSQPIPSKPEQMDNIQTHIPHMHHPLSFNQHKIQEPSVMKISPEIKASVEHSMNATLEALATSFNNIPDIQPERKYRPKNPYKTPDYYPTQPLPIFDKPAVFEKFDIDTLFFIFYHQQSTKQQYFASNELKKQSWRYHTKYLTWFRRHEEPKVIDKDYEEGTYVYFDYEINSWCQRKKSEFKFEYRYLEGQGSQFCFFTFNSESTFKIVKRFLCEQYNKKKCTYKIIII